MGRLGRRRPVGSCEFANTGKVKAAVSEVQDGRSFCLSLPLDLPGGNSVNPKRHPPKFGVVNHPPGSDGVYYNLVWKDYQDGNMDVSSDECTTLWNQYSTQWDSFAHVGSLFDANGDGEPESVYYNGFRAGEEILGPDHADGMGARALSVGGMAKAGMQGRGVILDMVPHVGRGELLLAMTALWKCSTRIRSIVEEGDFFLFHTGWDDMILDMAGILMRRSFIPAVLCWMDMTRSFCSGSQIVVLLR